MGGAFDSQDNKLSDDVIFVTSEKMQTLCTNSKFYVDKIVNDMDYARASLRALSGVWAERLKSISQEESSK